MKIENKVNYQRVLEGIIKEQNPNDRKSVLLHSCCAPCSSYVMEYLREFFDLTVFYFNPNITEREEYRKRVEEQKRLIGEMNAEKPEYQISFLEGEYVPERFFEIAKGREQDQEGGERCYYCYEIRLRESASIAKELGMDYFGTTLTISPLKYADKLNQIGTVLEEEFKVLYLSSDFKKKNGYKRSVELSKEHDLYRQDYCGCIYSKMQRQAEIKENLE
ncbi:MAG: epoxyqueuosine reductase QueH [Eubacteriales bacterium]